MRITGGIHRSRKLETPKGDAVRPTSDKVRQAVFNMLNSRGLVQDAIVIDAFCGTGALGLEALSQGAAYCTFFDLNKTSFQLCKNNIQALREEARSNLMLKNATNLPENLNEKIKADLVFLDPPYSKDLVPQAIESLRSNNWLSQDCFFVIEMAKSETLICENIQIENEKIYGDTKIILASLNNV